MENPSKKLFINEQEIGVTFMVPFALTCFQVRSEGDKKVSLESMVNGDCQIKLQSYKGFGNKSSLKKHCSRSDLIFHLICY